MKELKIQELKRGDLPNGEAIGQYRSPGYAALKYSMNPMAGGDVDLILTGAFSNSLFVVSKGDSKFIFDATDSKKASLVDKYGEDIMGLNQQAFEDLQRKDLKEQLKRKIISEFRV